VIYVSLNMLVCAVVFAPWAEPRETISGLLGRWWLMERGWKGLVGRSLGQLVNTMYWWEGDHCRQVFHVERRAREILYP
jgi:hypothetical protein